jgi:hypothetical protein
VTYWIANWLRAFALTLIVEIPIATPLLAAVEARIGRRVAVVVVANLATHPLVWFLFPGLSLGSAARLALSEAWALLAEIAIYMLVWPALRARRAALVSVAANGASLAAGIVIARLVGAR